MKREELHKLILLCVYCRQSCQKCVSCKKPQLKKATRSLSSFSVGQVGNFKKSLSRALDVSMRRRTRYKTSVHRVLKSLQKSTCVLCHAFGCESCSKRFIGGHNISKQYTRLEDTNNDSMASKVILMAEDNILLEVNDDTVCQQFGTASCIDTAHEEGKGYVQTLKLKVKVLVRNIFVNMMMK